MSLNDVVFLTKKVKKRQKGIIQKVMLVKDEFLFEYNGQKSLRTSIFVGKVEDIVPVKFFIKKVREMYYNNIDGRTIRDYIFNNSNIGCLWRF
jgi:hypothetical protein